MPAETGSGTAERLDRQSATGVLPDQRPHSIRFKDAAIERRFEQQYFTGAIAYFRVVIVVIIAISLGISVTGLFVQYPVNPVAVQGLLWFGVIPVSGVASVLLTRASWQRRIEVLVSGYLALVGAAFLVFLAVRPASFTGEYGYTYIALVLFFVFPLGRLPVRSAMAVAAVLVAGHGTVLCSHGFGAETTLEHARIFLLSLLTGYGIGYLLVAFQRRSFAYEYTISQQNVELQERNVELQQERETSERLLLNVLPEPIAIRLKNGQGTIADSFTEASVLFADIVGFSGLARTMAPMDLVELLADLFSGFDAIAERFALEKIKTVGDAYMVAAGVPLQRETHLVDIGKAALAMRDFVAEFSRDKRLDISVRIGIHTGSLVAGVIGRKKFAYDLWGDTVNIASRMESHGEPNQIQVSESTYEALMGHFALERRGEIDVKGQGAMVTYWLLDVPTS